MSATAALPDPLGVRAGQSVRRLANRSIRDQAADLRAPDHEFADFMCECGDLGCRELVTLRLSDFDELTDAGSVNAHQSCGTSTTGKPSGSSTVTPWERQ